MPPQVVAVEEPIEHLNEIAEAYGGIPAVATSRVDGLVESVGRPRPGAPYAGAPQTEVTLIH